MQTTSDLSLAMNRPQAMEGTGTSKVAAALSRLDPSPILIRWAGHMPYFMLGSKLMLPREPGLGAVLVMGLLYAVLAHFIAAWIGTPLAPQAGRLTMPLRQLAGALGLLLATSMAATAIAVFMPGEPGTGLPAGQGLDVLWQACLGLMLPACLGFYAVQVLTGRR